MRGNPVKSNLKNNAKRKKTVMELYRDLFNQAREDYDKAMEEVYAKRLKDLVGACFMKTSVDNSSKEVTQLYMLVRQAELNMSHDGKEHHILKVNAFTMVFAYGRFVRCTFEGRDQTYLGYAGKRIERSEYDNAIARGFEMVKNATKAGS